MSYSLVRSYLGFGKKDRNYRQGPSLSCVFLLLPIEISMASPKQILLFGDQTADVCPEIRYLTLESKHSWNLHSFLQNVTDLLQFEITKLGTRERERFRNFDSLISLAESHENGGLDVVVSTVLLCVAQLGLLILQEPPTPRGYFDIVKLTMKAPGFRRMIPLSSRPSDLLSSRLLASAQVYSPPQRLRQQSPRKG